ncbi:MAG: GNAT family N-acetyltransferase [Candidatus Diapherotrites archaeon]|nr:GNAT family N-acetyltransferase [Candidatus Diapherotrites archaeon]
MPLPKTLVAFKKIRQRAINSPTIRHLNAQQARLSEKNQVLERLIAGEKTRLKVPEQRFVQNEGIGGKQGNLEFMEISRKTVNKTLADNGFEAASESIQKIIGNSKRAIYLVSRYIPEAEQGKGIGTMLIQRARRIFEKRKIDLIYGKTRNPNAVKSYEAAGWIRLGRDETGHEYYGLFAKNRLDYLKEKGRSKRKG